MKGVPLLFSRIFLSASAFLFLFFLVEPMTHFHIIVFTTSFWPNALPCAPSPCTCLFISCMIFEKMVHHATIGHLSWSSGVVHFYQPSKSWKEPFTSLTLWQYQAAQLFEIVNQFNLTDLMPTRVN